jgi:hypothetical protein
MEDKQANTKAKLVFVDNNSKKISLDGKVQKTLHGVKNGTVPATALMCDIVCMGTSSVLAANYPRLAGIGLSVFSSYQLKKSANGENVIPPKWRKTLPPLQKAEDVFQKRPWESCMGISMGVSAFFLTAGIFTEAMDPSISGFTEIAKASLTNPEFWYGAYGIAAKSFALLREDEEQIGAEKDADKKKSVWHKAWNTVKKNGLKISAIALTPAVIIRAQTGISEMARHVGDSIKHASGCIYTLSVIPCATFLATKWFSDKKVAGMNFEKAMDKHEADGKIIRVNQNGIEAALTQTKVSKERQEKISKAFKKAGNYKPVTSVLVRHLEEGELFKVLDLLQAQPQQSRRLGTTCR